MKRQAFPLHLRVLALLGALAFGACGEEPRPTSAGREDDFKAALSVARMMREVGLPDVALSECKYVAENADGSQAPWVVEAVFLSGDCLLDKREMDEAIACYSDVGVRFPDEKPRASRKIAAAYLKRGRWVEALDVLQKVDRSGLPHAEKEEFEALVARILPITQLGVTGERDFGRRKERSEDVDFTFDRWVVRSPSHFTLFPIGGEEHGHVRIRIQKDMGGLWHPLPWKGGSFRLTIRLRIDAVDRREHQITGSFGIGNRKSFTEIRKKGISEEDVLSLRVRAITHIEGEHRSRDMSIRRARSTDEGTRIQAQTAHIFTDAPLDTWFRCILEYSRELALLRTRIFKVHATTEDLLLTDSILPNITPFGEGPFFLFFGEDLDGGDRLYTMELSVDYVSFEAHDEAPMPDLKKAGASNPLFRGNRHFFRQEWGMAAREWEKVSPEAMKNRWIYRFLMWEAYLRAGDGKNAEDLEKKLLENAKAFRPGEVDQIGRFARFDPDAERFLPKLKKAREER